MKRITTLLAVVTIFTLLLVGCNTHTCTYDESKWIYDETNHWHVCETCEQPGEKKAHDYSWAFDDNNHWQECACGSKTMSTAHVWGEGETIVAATEDNDGQIKYTCTCGKTKTDIIPRLEHTHVYGEWIKATAPTCTEDGELAHYHCDKCGTNFDADKNEMESIVDAKIGHDLDVSITTPATVDAEGLATYTCKNTGCDYSAALKVMRLPNVTVSGNVATWAEVENATGYKAIVGDAETDLGNALTYTIPANAVTDGCKIVAYTTNESYFATSEKLLTFTTVTENLQASLNGDFEEVVKVPSNSQWGLTYPYGNWSAMDYQIITESNGNTCAKLQPYDWWPKDIVLKKDCSGNIVNVGTYVIAIDVKLGPNVNVPKGNIVFALAYNGGYRTIADIGVNIASCTTDGWTTISYEYTITAEDNISSSWAQLDFTYWPETDLTDNYVLIDNIRVYAKDDATKTNIDGIAGGDFEIFSTFNENKWYVNDTILIEPNGIGSGIVNEDGNRVFKAYTKGVTCEFDLKGNTSIANGGIYKMTLQIKLGADNQLFDSLGFTAWAWTTDDGDAHQIVQNTVFGKLDTVGKDGYSTLEVYFTADNLANCKAINLFFWVGLNNGILQSADNYALIDNVTIQQVTIA